MSFKTNMSDTTALDAHLITAYELEFLISAEYTLTKGLASLADREFEGMVKTHSFPIYTKLTKVSSALTEDTEATREAMSDTAFTITPLEYGKPVMTTKLANLQSGGIPNLAAARLVANNMRESIEYIMILAGEAGTNEIIVTQAAESSLTASDIMTAADWKRPINKFRRTGIQGPFWAVSHDDILYDLRAETGTQGWTENALYADADSVLANEVGMFGGHRVIDSPLVTINADAGNAAVDSYHTQFFGNGAFAYSESEEPHGLLSGPFDNLARFLDFGWYGVFAYGLVDTNAHYVVTAASSLGTNT